MMENTGLLKQSRKRLESLRKDRSPFMADYRDISDFVLGVQSSYLHEGSQSNAGGSSSNRSERNESLYNETAKFSAQTLASGMMAGITSPARPWFNLATPDPDMMDFSPVKTWLDDVEKILYLVFARSNFYRAMHSQYLNLGVFGMGCFGVYEDYKNVARFDPFPVGSYMLAVNGQNEVDTLYREYSITVKACVGLFGIDKVSNTVKNMYDRGSYDEPVQIVHVMEPNDTRKYGSPFSQDKAFRSYYYEKSAVNETKLLRVSGFDDQAFMSPRWTTMGNDVYSSIYPGLDSLGTNKALQVNELDMAIAIEKQHNPPLVGDASIARDGVDLLAGGITFTPNMSATGKPGLAPVYDVSPDIKGLISTINEKENRIQRHFYADLFLMISEMDRAQITATEIAERKEEKLLMLGPVLESVNNEMLDPVIDRVFAIAQKAGILPPPPPELKDVDLKVEYISVLAQAQRAISTASMESTAAFAMNLSSVDPTAFDKINVDSMIDEHARAKGAPPSTIRSEDEVMEIRQARAMEEAQAQAQMQAQQAADTAATLGKATKDGGEELAELLG